MSPGRGLLLVVLIAVGLAAALVLTSTPAGHEDPPAPLAPLPLHPEHDPAAGPGALAAVLRVELEEAAELARAQAEDAFPPLRDPGGLTSAGPNPERERRQALKRDELAAAILLKYRARLAERHGLTLDELRELEQRARPEPGAAEGAAPGDPPRPER